MILLSAIKKEFPIKEQTWRLTDMLLMMQMEVAACSSWTIMVRLRMVPLMQKTLKLNLTLSAILLRKRLNIRWDLKKVLRNMSSICCYMKKQQGLLNSVFIY